MLLDYLLENSLFFVDDYFCMMEMEWEIVREEVEW